LEKVGKTFFRSIGAKKGKIVDNISSKLKILRRDRVKIVLVVKYPSKYDSSNYASVPTVNTALIPLCHTRFLGQN
jgi:hypothetical protein